MVCAICLKENISGPMTIDCGHTFCTICIYNWLYIKNEKNCPLCRNYNSKLLSSPVWKTNISGIILEKGIRISLSQEEINNIKNEFDISNLEYTLQIPNNYIGNIIMVDYNIICFGFKNENSFILNNCVVIQRDSGIAYPTNPKQQEIKDNSIYYLCS